MLSYVKSTDSITTVCALEIAHEALNKARELKREVAIVILDSAANCQISLRMDSAPPPCQVIAQRKASTALAFSSSTASWDERFKNLSPGVRQGLPLQEEMAFFGGGEPFIRKGTNLGSVGVSGASEAEDSIIAKVAVECFYRLITKP